MPGTSVKIYECRIMEVNVNDRVLTAVSIKGRIFKKISYLLPYISSIGSGFDCIPSVGDTCVVLDGGRGLEVVIGFRLNLADGDENGRELGGRLRDLPEGSLALRAIGEDGSEAKMILMKGGTAIMGSGSLANTVWTPAGGIEHLFDSWTMTGPGGHVKWLREKGSSKVSYNSEYRVNTNEEDDGFRVNVDIENGDVPVSISVTRKKDDSLPALKVSIDSKGIAKINANILEINAYARMELTSPNMIINKRRVQPLQEPI